MEELEYWKLKAAMAELQIEELNLQSALNSVRDKRLRLMQANNLDTNTQYRFNDKTFELEKV